MTRTTSPTNLQVTASRHFTLEDQRRFAKLSGDANPLHLDPIIARRLIFGGVVVHGVHSLLWALDAHLATGVKPIELTSVRAKFSRPIRLGEEASVRAANSGERHASLTVAAGSRVCTTVEVEYAARADREWAAVEALTSIGSFATARARDSVAGSSTTGSPTPRDLSFEQVSTSSGRSPIAMDTAILAERFPALAKRLPASQVAVLLATTRLVGMECPGLHSVFSAMHLQFNDASVIGESTLLYTVKRSDERFRLIVLDVSAPGVTGELTTFHRPAPRRQASMEEVSHVVNPCEFSEQRALIVGGSRGLGEVTAKLIAAGGGDVRITYHQGRDDADAVVQSIRNAGGICACSPWNVLAVDAFDPRGMQTDSVRLHQVETDSKSRSDPFVAPPLAKGGKRGSYACGPTGAGILTDSWHPTHLYYFAGPLIDLNEGNPFSADLYRRYRAFFVDAFERFVRAVRERADGRLVVFFPSTVFLDESHTGGAEYIRAKVEGEACCAELLRALPDTAFHYPRLPRMRTDQTNGFLAIPAEEPLPVMLATLRSMA